MRTVFYVFDGICETTSYETKCRLEKEMKSKARVELRKDTPQKPQLTPMRKAMLEQFGYVHPRLKDKVVLG